MLIKKTFSALFLIIGISLIFHSLGYGDRRSEIFREVIVMFKAGVLQFPKGLDSGSLDQIQILSPQVEQVLQRHSTEIILKAFPDFELADTLGFTPDGKSVYLCDLSEIYKIRLPEGGSRDSLIRDLTTLPEVVYAEPNGIAQPAAPVYPNDSLFVEGYQWALDNYGQSGGTDDADIDAPEAWEITTGSSNVKIGIIDGGVENWHEDLSGKVSGDGGWGWDGHGFHVAGIAAAKTDNDTGIAGVDWNAQIISQRVDNTDHEGIYDAIMDAVNAGADVLNNSWGSPTYSTTVRLAFANAYKLNRVAVVAMGNHQGSQTQYPAGFGQGIIAVGATDKLDERWSGSNTGNHIDVSAPGVDIMSCVPYQTPWGYYEPWDGTSMATPHVSGLASLLKAYDLDLYNDDIEQIIRLSAEDVNSAQYPGWDEYLGMGRINAREALDLLQSPNYLAHWTASGGYQAGNTGVYEQLFFGVPGLASGVYLVKRYEVRHDVTFPQPFTSTPYAWGRGVGTTGYSPVNPNFGMGYCDFISVSSIGGTLRTWVYDVWTVGGTHVGWIPCAPENVSFAYTALGQPSLSSPTNLIGYNTGGCEASISLSWQDNSDDEDGFNIYRDGLLTGSVDADVTSFTQTYLNPGQTYSYYVKAYKEGWESNSSNVVNLVPGPLTPEAPTNLQVVNVGGCQFLATWEDNSAHEDGFAINNGSNRHGVVGPNVTSYQGHWYPEDEWAQQGDFYVYAYDGYPCWVACKAYSNHVVIDPPGGVIPAPSNVQLQGSGCNWNATWQNNDTYDQCRVKHLYGDCDYWYTYYFLSSCGGTSISPPSGYGCFCVSVQGGKWVDCGSLGNTKWSGYSNRPCAYDVLCNNPNPGCPYLFVYDGEKFMGENTILASVEMAQDRRLDVNDYYLVKQSVIPIDNMYKLRIAEFEQEHSFLDQVELLAVDHDFGLEVAVTGDGEIFVYNPADFLEPISCYDEKGANHDSLLRLDPEERAFMAGPGSLVLNFGPVPQDSGTQILLLPCCGDGGIPKNNPKVAAGGEPTPQIGLLVEVEKDGFWQEASLIPPRMAAEEVFINLTNFIDADGRLKVKLNWDERGYSFSKFRCFQSERFDQRKRLTLVNASHSTLGDVTQKLTFDDNDYVELLPDQNIDLGFSDLPAEPGKVRSFVFECNGHYLTENLANVSASTPSSEELQQNYPNPFNPQTQIQFNLVEVSKVSVVIYNLLGQKMITLVDETLPPGKHVINWNGEDESGQKVASGIYFYRLQAGEYNQARKMILMK